MLIILSKGLSYRTRDVNGKDVAFKAGIPVEVSDETGEKLLQRDNFKMAPRPKPTVEHLLAARAKQAAELLEASTSSTPTKVSLDILKGSPKPVVKACQSQLVNKLPPSLSGKEVLMVIKGGVGDILWTTPIIRALKRISPDVEIDYATESSMACLVNANDGIRRVLSKDQARQLVSSYPVLLTFKGALSQNPNAYQDHATRVLAAWVGVDIGEDMALDLKVPAGFDVWAQQRFLERGLTDEKIICIAVDATAKHKMWPSASIMSLVELLLSRKNTAVALVGRSWTGSLPKDERILNFVGKTTLEQALGVVASSTAFVGPDSGLLHAADAFKIPSVGLFGPFSGQLSVTPGGTVHPLSANVSCSPCNRLLSGGCDNPGDDVELYGRCMEAIEPELVNSILVKSVF